jgi:hypothetical protein
MTLGENPARKFLGTKCWARYEIEALRERSSYITLIMIDFFELVDLLSYIHICLNYRCERDDVPPIYEKAVY